MTASRQTVGADGRVVLPDGFAGRVVTVEAVSDTEVRISVVRPRRSVPSLAALMAQVPDENMPEFIDFGPPVGNEAL